MEDGSGNRPMQPSPLTLASLGSVQSQGANTFLTADINNGKGSFLRGQNPLDTANQPATYTFVVPKSNDVVDLFYWQFCPFNEAKKVPIVGQVGDRQSPHSHARSSHQLSLGIVLQMSVIGSG